MRAKTINEVRRGLKPSPSLIGTGARTIISRWLDERGVTDYVIDGDLTIGVTGDVDLSGKIDGGRLPSHIRFGRVGGGFHCGGNSLTTLEGAPREVGGDFYCGGNPVKFTEGDVRERTNVGKNIYI